MVQVIDFTCVDHVNMFVKNLEESIAFYHRVFGTDENQSNEVGIKGSGGAS